MFPRPGCSRSAPPMRPSGRRRRGSACWSTRRPSNPRCPPRTLGFRSGCCKGSITVQVRSAGLASTLKEPSVAATWKVCDVAPGSRSSSVRCTGRTRRAVEAALERRRLSGREAEGGRRGDHGTRGARVDERIGAGRVGRGAGVQWSEADPEVVFAPRTGSPSLPAQSPFEVAYSAMAPLLRELVGFQASALPVAGLMAPMPGRSTAPGPAESLPWGLSSQR